MSEMKLAYIEDVFDVTGRGIIIAPGFPASSYSFTREYKAAIRLKSGTVQPCKAQFTIPMQSPPPKELLYFCHLTGLEKNQIPIGSELWLIDVSQDEIKA